MVKGKEAADRVKFSYTKCDGTFHYSLEVDKEWFDAHNTESTTPEEMDKLAYEDRDNSKVIGKITCWGLG